jgi:hypothetical protein
LVEIMTVYFAPEYTVTGLTKTENAQVCPHLALLLVNPQAEYSFRPRLLFWSFREARP